MLTLLELVSLLKEVIISIATIIGSIVAWRGLKSWKSQLRGTTEYQVSEKVLEKSYMLQDYFKEVRDPLLGPKRVEPNKGETIQESFVRGELEAYRRRLERVNDAKRELRLLRFKVKALFGEDKSKKIDSLLSKVSELYIAYNAYFTMKLKRQRTAEEEEIMDENWKKVYWQGTKDAFEENVNRRILDIEKEFRQYLK